LVTKGYNTLHIPQPAVNRDAKNAGIATNPPLILHKSIIAIMKRNKMEKKIAFKLAFSKAYIGIPSSDKRIESMPKNALIERIPSKPVIAYTTASIIE
jgi:hypothetical protein